ncbi:Cas9 inhibitor AcrIIA9 family protein [Parablautia sp. Marseille-Q6255]|uniref:Cas9 inhibitor AcrIIA9 family protein n=1 Tax=Parablautia sp. Marseille-Q6255 TaxID=3039593 RepID=UPI0024BCBC84|nr:Cas9 inhibitor AcrIIA9 family protein [Parablautia sp. Marseille-Q6255]
MSEQLKQELGVAENDRLEAETAIDSKNIGERKKEAVEGKIEAQKGNESNVKQRAREKLEAEMEKANSPEEKNHVNSIIPYLIKRCEEDISMAEDVLQECKTWAKCYKYITSKIFEWMDKNKVAKRGHVSLAFEDHVIYEWAEDYYHKKEEKPAPAKNAGGKKTSDKKQATAKKAVPSTEKGVPTIKETIGKVNSTTKKDDTTIEKFQTSKKDVANKQQKKEKTNTKSSEISGQMSLFDFL